MNTSEHNKLSEEANRWVVRLRSDNADAIDKASFSRWLNRSDAHEQAFDAALADWQILGALEHTPAAKATLRHFEPTPSSWGWLWQWQSAALASFALVAVLSVGFLQALNPPAETAAGQHFATARGEQRLIRLEDGSEVKLNTNSSLHIEYTEAQRFLVLDKGEAFFKVTTNRARPFVVDVGDGTVTAVGTAFAINKTDTNIEVTVLEGIVSVKERETQPQIKPESQVVKADERLTLDKQGLSDVRVTNAQQLLAWRDSLLVLENQPLPTALAELNRYLDTPVDTSHPSLAKLKVSGTFSLQTPESTLAALVTTFGLQLDESSATPRLYVDGE
ncbi:FecR family protein [Simiduia sp. 21SJ11W-1]|uniref:FecR family protein n=1 Tax=Simiduia sp. 21SJ11W-1 TaxID=2909669 RepID=UPI0020A1F923|nr:FecR family protein [Simiduia sp. 21SJ11W-1]UTA48794.1 FecR family protein [Simiduia sp. 21SJ11W-1]